MRCVGKSMAQSFKWIRRFSLIQPLSFRATRLHHWDTVTRFPPPIHRRDTVTLFFPQLTRQPFPYHLQSMHQGPLQHILRPYIIIKLRWLVHFKDSEENQFFIFNFGFQPIKVKLLNETPILIIS